MRTRGIATITAGGGALMAFASGCGGDSGRRSPTVGATGPREDAGRHVIVMTEYAYAPPAVTVRVGEPVIFVNRGRIEHTVADTTPGGGVRSKLIKPRPLAPGDEQRVLFSRPGVVNYLCTFHPTLMKGRIVVER